MEYDHKSCRYNRIACGWYFRSSFVCMKTQPMLVCALGFLRWLMGITLDCLRLEEAMMRESVVFMCMCQLSWHCSPVDSFHLGSQVVWTGGRKWDAYLEATGSGCATRNVIQGVFGQSLHAVIWWTWDTRLVQQRLWFLCWCCCCHLINPTSIWITATGSIWLCNVPIVYMSVNWGILSIKRNRVLKRCLQSFKSLQDCGFWDVVLNGGFYFGSNR